MTFACRVLDRQIRAELSLLDDGLSVLLAGGDKSTLARFPWQSLMAGRRRWIFPVIGSGRWLSSGRLCLPRSAAAGQRWSAVFTMMGLPVRAFSVC